MRICKLQKSLYFPQLKKFIVIKQLTTTSPVGSAKSSLPKVCCDQYQLLEVLLAGPKCHNPLGSG